VIIYPNPVIKGTGNIFMVLKLSQDAVKIRLKIYTKAFRAVREIRLESGIKRGYNTLRLDPRSCGNLANGLYYYTAAAENENGDKTRSKAGHLMILR
jgi:flagellar hook assembly protein FlgD